MCMCAVIQRNIHSSPAAFTIDRVVQRFRARSALLVSRLEDDDEVLHKTFSDCDDKDDDVDDAVDELASDQTNNK